MLFVLTPEVLQLLLSLLLSVNRQTRCLTDHKEAAKFSSPLINETRLWLDQIFLLHTVMQTDTRSRVDVFDLVTATRLRANRPATLLTVGLYFLL